MSCAEDDLKARIRDRARAEGFDRVGFAAADLPAARSAAYRAFVAAGMQGDMAWLGRDPERRAHPKGLWPEARSVVVVAMTYGPTEDPRELLARHDRAAISVYARGGDYHDLMKSRLKALARWLQGETGAGVKVFVDTAPVLEKPLAQAAGVGWQGKHSNLVARELGSWFFLGEVFTTLDLPPDPPEIDHCGTCRRCLDACPTDAFLAPYRLDPRRCISYLTIEAKAQVPHAFRAAIGNRVYGCDDCLAVCPWNKFASRARESRLQARDGMEAPPLAELACLDDAGFRARFAGSAIKRTGRDRFVRNVLIAIGNSGDPALAEPAQERLGDESPLVRGMAIWALARLLTPEAFAVLRARNEPKEHDMRVRAEWRA